MKEIKKIVSLLPNTLIGCPSRIRTYGMSESESDALPLGYGAIKN